MRMRKWLGFGIQRSPSRRNWSSAYGDVVDCLRSFPTGSAPSVAAQDDNGEVCRLACVSLRGEKYQPAPSVPASASQKVRSQDSHTGDTNGFVLQFPATGETGGLR